MTDERPHPSPEMPSARKGRRHRPTRGTSVALALRWAAGRWRCVDPEVAGLHQVVRPGSVCLDIGAECGVYTWVLASLAGPTGQVYTAEPPDRSRWSVAISLMLGRGNVVVHSPHVPGRLTGREAAGQSRRRTRQVRCAEDLPRIVRVISRVGCTVDALCRQEGLQKVDFIKANVADANTDVLMGAFSTLLRDRPALLLEIEDGRLATRTLKSTDLVRSLTQSLGYDMYCWSDGNWEPVTRVTEDVRNYLFSRQPLTRHGRIEHE
ncbi:FkbM family methyltransferase [Streptomyces canus]|uniref:FkbM family methyltransferase n=1 Tax=Streptomyces canus TaxID=58343 RepID=UPI002E29F237|nr:FkbM family methyltransferase [Streptomyces canus]